ncbi:hypothetical protein [Streptomyces bluensis]|uniref:hypothetical protein n=1 Tax=Streptomyces bluensis TaxID=33897 RepID=UPI003333ECC1
MQEITTTDPPATQQLTTDQLAERVAVTDEELDQGPDVLANLAAEKMRAQGQLPPPEWVRGHSARGR